MKLKQHGVTSILYYNNIENWVIQLIIQCLNFYPEATRNVKMILIRSSTEGQEGNVGLAIPDIKGFVIYWDTMLSMAEKHAKKGVNPMATLANLIADTVFHESHHVNSYHKDYEWTCDHRKQEETDAEKVSMDLCIEFFKTIPVDIPMGGLPYVYKDGMSLITDMREYFNLLLNPDEKWKSLDISLSTPAAEKPKNNYTDPLANQQQQMITPKQAKGLYITCFENIFGSCGPTLNGFNTPEKILGPIKIPSIVKSTFTMLTNGNTISINNPKELTGIIYKTSKLPGYDFTLLDNKNRRVIPQNPQKRNNKGEYTKEALQAQEGNKIGYVIDINSNKFLLKYNNGILTQY